MKTAKALENRAKNTILELLLYTKHRLSETIGSVFVWYQSFRSMLSRSSRVWGWPQQAVFRDCGHSHIACRLVYCVFTLHNSANVAVLYC